MKKHAELSASGSERWIKCPASVSLSKLAPPLPESPAAKEGTLAHEYLEAWLRSLIAGEPKTPAPLKKLFDMKYNVEIAFNHIKNIWRPKKEILTLEEKVSLEHINPGMFGTADIVIDEPYGTLQVWDYKHGKGHKVKLTQDESGGEEDSLNTQLVYYALGVLKKYDYDFDKVTLGIIQPRAGGEKIRSVTVPASVVIKYEDYFKRAIEKVYSKKPQTTIGPWCYFCPAKDFNCPEHKSKKIEDLFND